MDLDGSAERWERERLPWLGIKDPTSIPALHSVHFDYDRNHDNS